MQTFLQLVAQDLYKKIGNDLSRVAIVFPNKRASLFFNEHLAAQSDRPLWSPAYVSISELFRQLSPWKLGDPIRLVCELYKVFREETHSEETLDDFYFWGELLISDFDDVDKNLVDADRLFSNLQDLKNIMDDYDFLDSEQEEAIRQFFQNFSIERRTQLKEKFISLWDKLGDIYHGYRDNLAELGIAYEGMMYRYVMEELQPEKLKYDRYVFVGFNVLNKVETRFFERLRDAGRALFYWDYDLFYTRLPREKTPPYTHEAGEFIPKIKLSENVEKVTNPGNKNVYRIYDKETGKIKADLICLVGEVFDESKDMKLFDPNAPWKKTTLPGGSYTLRELLVPVFQKGECVYESPSVMDIQRYCTREKDTIWDETKRFVNPQEIYVDLSDKLYEMKTALLNKEHM